MVVEDFHDARLMLKESQGVKGYHLVEAAKTTLIEDT